MHVVRPVTPHEVEELFGTTRPTTTTVRNSLHALTRNLDRGESIALATCNESGSPAHWVFIGYTVD